MKQKWISLAVSGAMLLMTAGTSFAQPEPPRTPAAAVPDQGSSGGASTSGGAGTSGGASTSGGATSGGAASEAPAPAPEAAPAPLAAGPVAPAPVAAGFAVSPLWVLGGAAAVGIIVCVIVCGKSTTSTQTH